MFLKKALLASCAVLAFAASGAFAAEQYIVGTGATYRPFEYETPQKELVGFDVDLMRAIAKAEGFEVKFINTPWEGILPLLTKATATSSCPASLLQIREKKPLTSLNLTSWLTS